MWLIILAIAMLIISAHFSSYLMVFYSRSFQIATFAKAASMIISIVALTILFVTVGWWGFAGILGYTIVSGMSAVHWKKVFRTHLIEGTDPWHGKLEEKQSSD